ncbi:hypothetical protein V2J09_002099 [Rumex salicifolius]
MSIASVVNLVAGKIGELLVEEAKLLYGVEDQIRSLQEEFMMMQSFLIDMEAMDEEGGDERSRTTIKQIRKIAYDAEDVIESYIIEASNSSADKTEDLLKRYFCFCSSIPRTHQIGSEIVAIKARIGETMERWKKYVGESGILRSIDARNRDVIRSVAYSHTIEDHVVGIDEDINKLIRVLTTDDDEDIELKLVSIVGMGGSGKTTLARKLFNHEIVKKHFDCIAWVSVSQQWAVKQILLDLLRKTSGEIMRTDEVWSLELVVEMLHRHLERQRYLIVLDDVWEEKALQDILPALPLGSSHDGKKIIVTTRNKNVVDFPDVKCFIHEPRRLTEEESWELFTKIVLVHRERSYTSMDDPDLEALGKDMLKKCEGLPLAVIALAGILGKKESVEDWERMKTAVSSRIMEDGSGTHLYGPVSKMLALSYYDFPRELKPCFLYLAMFPEDHEIVTTQLIQMWIAEGFIASDKVCKGETLEDVARAYLDELVHRCMVQVVYKDCHGKVKCIRVHDLVRDLCINKAKEENFLETFSSESPNPITIVTESRRVAIYSRDTADVPLPTKNQYLRSLFCQGDVQMLTTMDATKLNFRLLRVLLLRSIKTSDGILPTEIGSLIHLRYLGLRYTNISELPSSIGKLRNLLTLDYRIIVYTRAAGVQIPDVIWEIEGLRHLYLPGDYYKTIVKVESLKLHTLKNLQKLWGGFVRGSWMLKELPRLSPSVKKLTIRGITSKKQLEAAFQCPSILSDSLHSLDLRWNNMSDEVVKLDSLESIIHSQHLRKLRLRGRIGDGFKGTHFPTSINKLRLSSCVFGEEATLVALGKLPHLVILDLWHGAYSGTSWTCSEGEFPRLKELRLHSLSNWEEWSIERRAMPQLKKLQIVACKKLKRIPEGLKFITTLQELRLQSVNDECKTRIRGEDAYIIQHVPLVHF